MANALQSGLSAAHAATRSQASSDGQLVALWLGQYRAAAGGPSNTAKAYAGDVRAFRAFEPRPLQEVTVGDLQAFVQHLAVYSQHTQARRVSAIKSLFAFGHRIGYLAFDVGAVIRLQPIKDTLAQRIMTEEQVTRLLWQADQDAPRSALGRRNAAILRLLYVAGLRISELCGLCWCDLVARHEGGQVTIYGKGGKTRVVLLPAPMWARVTALRAAPEVEGPVFRAANGHALARLRVHRIVKRAFLRAKLPLSMSAHYLRHAHASHSLDRGCPVHVLQQTLGHASLVTTTKYVHARPGDSSSRYLAT